MTGRHIERHPLRRKRLGRRRPDLKRINDPSITLRLGDILRVPTHATAADHLAPIADWTMLGNDQWGDCGPVSVANSRRITTKALTGVELQPTLDQVLDLYRRSGNPTFDPKTGAGDNGVDMREMLQATMAGGFAGVRPVAFASVNARNQLECEAAIDIFGFLLLGLDLQVAQQAQLDSRPPLWDYRRSGEWGGHAVCAGAYTGSDAARTNDVSVVSWAEVVGTTDTFWGHQVDEAWVVIWPEHLGSAAFHAGIDTATANSIYSQLTGKPGPFPDKPPPPPPVPPPPVPPPSAMTDVNLWASMKSWAKGKGFA